MKCYHVSERCIHGETKRNLCDHKVPWAKHGYREVPCEPSFCPIARQNKEDQ